MKHNIVNKAIYLLLFIAMLMPLYFMLIGSIQDSKGAMAMPPRLLPYKAFAGNYQKMISWPLGIWLKNTITVLAGSVALSCALSLSAGYAFAFHNFKFKKMLWVAMLAGLMIPRISLLIPQYVIIKKIGIPGTMLAVIISTSFSPMGLYLARTYFGTIPMSLIESARIDGASEIQVLCKVVAPASMPIATTLALFAGISSLQDYIWQMLVLQSESRQTMLIGMMREVMRRGGGDLNLNPAGRSMAVGIVLLLPLLIIFIAANRYFTESLDGAVKE